MDPIELIESQSHAARNLRDDFGAEQALNYLIGEKFLNFLEVAETDRPWRQAIPTFVAEIKGIFEPWQIAEFLRRSRRLEALAHADGEAAWTSPESDQEWEKVRPDATNQKLLEWAKELLLEEAGQ
jgi:hypothetical protein